MNYIQQEFFKIHGYKSSFSDETIFEIVKTFYMGQLLMAQLEQMAEVKQREVLTINLKIQ